ncbi:MAG: hypothetical protein AAGJ70_06120 [Pseudomonadota bacterium]
MSAQKHEQPGERRNVSKPRKAAWFFLFVLAGLVTVAALGFALLWAAEMQFPA